MNLMDVQETVTRVGVDAGFRVMREFPIVYWDILKHGFADVAWFRGDSREPHVLFEIEGINVPMGSLEGDIRKFKWGEARHNVLVLYTHRDGNPLVKDDTEAGGLVHQRLLSLVEGFPPPEVLLPNAWGLEEMLIARIQEDWGDA